MTISKKLYRKIRDELQNAFNETIIKTGRKSLIEDAPDSWIDEDREIFDLLSEHHYLVSAKLDALFTGEEKDV